MNSTPDEKLFIHKRIKKIDSTFVQIVEEKCELEEAENDSRLRAQM